MGVDDMKKYEYFNVNEINTLEELKKEFKRLAFKLHPDKGGDAEKFKAFNNEYEELFKIYKNKSTNTAEKNENIDTFRNIINELINIDNLTIEIIGTWIWVSGKGTYKIKEKLLNELNFFYSGKHKCYMYNGGKKQVGFRNKWTKKDIENHYGKETVKSNNKHEGNNKYLR